MKKHHSSKRWMKEHVNDAYVKKARQQGYRSRAAFKLIEINDRDHILRPGMTVVELGAAPGGWSQITAQYVGEKGRVIATDILPMESVPGVEFIQGDFREQPVFDALITALGDKKADLVISDMAPNISGMDSVDQPRAIYLAELSVDLAHQVLVRGGDILIKVFQGAGCDAFIKELRKSFEKVLIRKPGASRSRSREIYILARNYQLE